MSTTVNPDRSSGPPVRVIVAGGYGYFGSRIVTALARESNVRVIVGGRNAATTRRMADAAGLEHVTFDTTGAGRTDALTGLRRLLLQNRADLVVDASGAFASRDYLLARAAIAVGASYINIADSRRHVCDVGILDAAAREQGVLVVTGASSVPALSSAVIDHHLPQFAELHQVTYGISASELTPGAAAVASVLGYCGQIIPGYAKAKRIGRRGWQGGRLVRFERPLGWRWLARCDVPDLELFPKRYPTLRDLDFRAGVAMLPSMAGIWIMSWLVRLGVMHSAQPLASRLRRWARLLEPFGAGCSGMYLDMVGIDHNRQGLTRRWQLVASHNDGPLVAAMGSVALVRKIARSGLPRVGAMPCLGLVTLPEYLDELRDLQVKVHSR